MGALVSAAIGHGSAPLRDYAAGPYSQRVWERVRPVVADIEGLPFLAQLADGTLAEAPFVNYLLQDEYYLGQYAQAMSLLAARAPEPADMRFWALAAADSLVVEQQMHEALLAEDRFAPALAEVQAEVNAGLGAIPSPTTAGYSSFVVAQAATAPYAVGVAAVLPCFWVYAHVGKVLVARPGAVSAANPYRAWVETYDSAEFDASVDGAVAIYERVAAEAGDGESGCAVRAAMEEAFVRATAFEYRFWNSAHARENWGR